MAAEGTEAIPTPPFGLLVHELLTYLQSLVDRLEDLLAHYQDCLATVVDDRLGNPLEEDPSYEPDVESHTEED